MTRVQLVLTDEDHDRFVRAPRRLLSAADLEAFFARCDALDGPALERDLEEHLAVIEKSRMRGRAPT